MGLETREWVYAGIVLIVIVFIIIFIKPALILVQEILGVEITTQNGEDKDIADEAEKIFNSLMEKIEEGLNSEQENCNLNILTRDLIMPTDFSLRIAKADVAKLTFSIIDDKGKITSEKEVSTKSSVKFLDKNFKAVGSGDTYIVNQEGKLIALDEARKDYNFDGIDIPFYKIKNDLVLITSKFDPDYIKYLSKESDSFFPSFDLTKNIDKLREKYSACKIPVKEKCNIDNKYCIVIVDGEKKKITVKEKCNIKDEELEILGITPKDQILKLVDIYANEYNGYGITRALIKAMIQRESNFDQCAISCACARGLMQLTTPAILDISDTKTKAGALCNGMLIKKPFEADKNIKGGTCYITSLLIKYKQNKELALAAYNSGSENINKAIENCKNKCFGCNCNDWNVLKSYLITSQNYKEETIDYVKYVLEFEKNY